MLEKKHHEFREKIRAFAVEYIEPAAVTLDIEQRFLQQHIKPMADIGLMSMLIPEDYGGSGGGWVDTIVAFEEFGRSLFRNPHFEINLAASLLLKFGTDAQKETYLNQLSAGKTVITVGGMTPETNLIPAEAVRKNGTYEIEEV